ncbi:transposase [Bradyrhizobium sp. 18]|uniref:transposase n=1 Tax=Bradyrhizobium sp. 18 TaxID=2782657 RepID=UPI001FF912F7|nr:transposase [Bradyrhizobium sp. 18]MCK1504305.1 transposase [Bradyrhizobium sp. 18]
MSKDSRKDSDKDRHTPILEHGADTLRRVEIITGTGRRRRWSTDAKAAIAESFAPGASVSAVARGHDISPSLLFLWRRQTTRVKLAERRDGDVPPGFVPGAIAGCGGELSSREEQQQLRSKSARFASLSGGRSTGGRCARCLRQSGRLADDRVPT